MACLLTCPNQTFRKGCVLLTIWCSMWAARGPTDRAFAQECRLAAEAAGTSDKQKHPDPDLTDSAYPPRMQGARVETYKTIGDAELRLYLFMPDGHAPGAKRPAIVFFFGGGWRSGNPRQFEQQCRYLAARGMVAVAADYRVTTRHRSRGIDSVRDAKSAVRWLRANADRLGIDPQRIAAGGGSAGGHLAATTGVAPGLDEATEDPDISSVPNTLVLFNPFLVALKVEGSGLDYPRDITHSAGIEPIKISPYHHVRAGLPPTIIFHGKADKTVPFQTAEMYTEKAGEMGNRCELVAYDDADHGFFNYGKGDGQEFVDTVHRMDGFLTSLGWLTGEPIPLDPQDFSREAARRRFGSVRLRVNIAPGTQPPTGWGVTTGIPFQEGGLTTAELDSLRVVAADGRASPAQFEVRGQYPESKDIRWLGVFFQLDLAAKGYRLVRPRQVGPAPAEPVIIEESKTALVITTGDLKVEQPKAGPMLAKVWLKGQLVLDQSGEGNWLVDLEGRRHTEKVEEVSIARRGPVLSTLRVKGRYVDPAGKPTCKFTVDLHFWAGQPQIELTHKQDELQIKDLAVSFGLADRAVKASVDASAAPDQRPYQAAITGDGMLAVLQDSLYHHGGGADHFGIFEGTPSHPREVRNGTRAGGWIGATGTRATVSLALRDLWQQFPKELRAEPGRLTAFFWSTRGAAPAMDLRVANLEKIAGPTFWSALHKGYVANQLSDRFKALHDPTGMGRTHDLLLRFDTAEVPDEEVAARGETFDHQPLVYPDPEWTWASKVCGNLSPRDHREFPELEEIIDRSWDLGLGVLETWGDYGFLWYGDGPHQGYEIDRTDQRLKATDRRYASTYGVGKAAWEGFLRSGDRRLFDYALAHSRWFNDLTFTYEDSNCRLRGMHGGNPLMPWRGWAIDGNDAIVKDTPAKGLSNLAVEFWFYIEYALYHYYLTGDPRSLEVACEHADAYKTYIELVPGWLDAWQQDVNEQWSRGFSHKMHALTVLYEQFHDPWLKDMAREVALRVIDLDRPSGIYHTKSDADPSRIAEHPRFIFYKAPWMGTWMKYAEGDDLKKGRESFLRMADFQVRAERFHAGMGKIMSEAYEMTGDPIYLGKAMAFVREHRGAWDDRWPLKNVTNLMGIGESVLGKVVPNTVALIGTLRAHPDVKIPQTVPLLKKDAGFPAAEFVFQKAAGESLEFDLASYHGVLEAPGGKPFLEEWQQERIEYRVAEWDTPLVFQRIKIPRDAVEGVYRVKLAYECRGWVISTIAKKYGVVAPGGLQLPVHAAQPMYFSVLATGSVSATTARTLTLYGNDLSFTQVHDEAGKPVVLNRRSRTQATLTVPPGRDGELWSLVDASGATVLVDGIVPVFAPGSADHFFVPEAVPQFVPPKVSDADSDTTFTEGLSGRGLLVNGEDVLSLDLPSVDEGTVEFWFQPTWTSGGLTPPGTTRPLLIFRKSQQEETSALVFRQDGPLTRVFLHKEYPPSFRNQMGANNSARWARGTWNHLAFVWDKDKTWAVYVNGVGAGSRVRRRVGSEPFQVNSEVRLFVGSDPDSKTCLNAVIDRLLISSTARYDGQTFEPPRDHKADEDTLGFFEFEGTTDGTGSVKLRFENR